MDYNSFNPKNNLNERLESYNDKKILGTNESPNINPLRTTNSNSMS